MQLNLSPFGKTCEPNTGIGINAVRRLLPAFALNRSSACVFGGFIPLVPAQERVCSIGDVLPEPSLSDRLFSQVDLFLLRGAPPGTISCSS